MRIHRVEVADNSFCAIMLASISQTLHCRHGTFENTLESYFLKTKEYLVVPPNSQNGTMAKDVW